jgi:hypothetical protein
MTLASKLAAAFHHFGRSEACARILLATWAAKGGESQLVGPKADRPLIEDRAAKADFLRSYGRSPIARRYRFFMSTCQNHLHAVGSPSNKLGPEVL